MPNARAAVRRLFLFAFASMVLAACGGGSGSGGSPSPVVYADYQAQLSALQATWAGVGITDPVTLPVGGSATYNGAADLSVQTSAGARGLAGELTLTANFSTDSLAGSATNFVDENDMAMAGSLIISGGALDRGADTSITHTFSANIDGTLSGGGDSFLIRGDISGDFLGPNALGMSGVFNGTAISSFGTGFMFGDFFAEQ